MLQNKLSFNQSSVSLEIIGVPDLSNNESQDKISIISQWRLKIINQPLIEGNKDHLSSIMKAFYIYSNSLINYEAGLYKSKLIDIVAENLFTHNVLLKSSKPDVEPLTLKIGNSVLTDIINCFDQLNSSSKVRIASDKNFLEYIPKNSKYNFHKNKIPNLLIPPLISIFSLFFASSALIYFYNVEDSYDKKAYLYSSSKFNSI